MIQAQSTLVRLALGAVLGAAAWPLLSAALPAVPELLRFLLAFGLFTLGPGMALGWWLTRDLDNLSRVIVLLGVGGAAAALLIDGLGRVHLVPAFPYLATACVGAGLAAWSSARTQVRARTSSTDLAIAGALVVLAAGLGAIVFWHRLGHAGGGVQLFGDYDSADLGYYASEASEATHTVPPTAAYYSGHKLNAAYYPHLVLGMIHRFTGVPVLSMYYGYAWPAFDAIIALTLFALVRSLASRATAALSVVFLLVCSDFSYLAAWFLPHAAVDWDYVLWPTNFLSPTMQVLHFATWAPSLPVFFTALFAIVRGFQTGKWGWFVLGAVVTGILFEFKPFIYLVLMAALAASAVFSGRDRVARRRFAVTVVLAVIFTVPSIVGAATLDPEDRRTRLLFEWFMLPKRMLIKLDLVEPFERTARSIAPWPSLETPLLLAMAVPIFFAVGVGVRWIGAPGVWRAIRGGGGTGPDAPPWRLLGWGVVAGLAIPCVLRTDPYVDSLQFYLTGLYLMWIFTAAALVGWARKWPVARSVAIVLAIAATFPSSLHYLQRRWTDQTRPPRAALTRNELLIAEQLRQSDPEATVVLHDRPLAPSLTTIVAERRIVLGWDVRYSAVGGEGRLRDVNAFFESARGNPADAFEILRRYRVTHVIVRFPDDQVHPDVLAGLSLVMDFPDVKLYRVPPDLAR